MNTRCSEHVEDNKNWIKTLILKLCILLVALNNNYYHIFTQNDAHNNILMFGTPFADHTVFV